MKEAKKLIAFRCERSATEQLAALAQQGDRSLSAEIRCAVREHVATQEPRPSSAGTDAGRADAASTVGAEDFSAMTVLLSQRGAAAAMTGGSPPLEDSSL